MRGGGRERWWWKGQRAHEHVKTEFSNPLPQIRTPSIHIPMLGKQCKPAVSIGETGVRNQTRFVRKKLEKRGWNTLFVQGER